MARKVAIIITAILITVSLSGCWDKVEINERAFVTAVGIDKHTDIEDVEDESDDAKDKDIRDRFTVTYVYPNIEAKGKQGQGEPRFLVSSTGVSPYETSRELRTRLNQVLFFHHMKVLVIGEETARNSDMLKEILDGIERSNQINRKVVVLIAKGKAQDILSVESKFEADTGIYLSNISNAPEGSARFNPLTLGEVLASLHSNKNAMMPRVVAGKDDIKVAGSAVIKNYQLIGWLGEIENRSALFLKDEIISQTLVVTYYKDEIIVPYIITNSSTKMKSSTSDGKIVIDYMIQMEGDLSQFKLDTKETVMDAKILTQVEKSVEDEVKKQILGTLKKLQKEFKVDVIGVGEHLSKYKPEVWKMVKDDWENIFPDIEVNVSVEAKIRRVGLTR